MSAECVPSSATMTTVSLLGWLWSPSSRHGIHFGCSNNCWRFYSYEQIAESAKRVAIGLLDRGLQQGEVVSLIQRSGPDFIASLFGTMLAGGVPAPAPPPEVFEHAGEFERRTAGLLRGARPTFILIDDDSSRTFHDFAHKEGFTPICVSVGSLLSASGKLRPPDARRANLALLQFTSGSSDSFRAVRVPFEAIEANVGAIHEWLQWTEDDATASWLPLHHDMGLVGCFLGAVLMQSDLWLLDPRQFIRSPLRYLQCFGEKGARLTALPNFALDYMVRRVRPQMLTGMDFSGWRAAIVGSERLRTPSFAAFHDLLAPFGLPRTTLLPAYGLAEATLAVTGLPLFTGWRQVTIDPMSTIIGRRINLIDDPILTGNTHVGCGVPLRGVSVFVEDDSGRRLNEGYLGEIVVSGPTVAEGYLSNAGESDTRFDEQAVHTGDIGFMHQGELFVVGRFGDSVKVRGRTVFAEDLEAALGELRIPSQRLAVMAGFNRGKPGVVVLIEHPLTVDIALVLAIVRPRIGEMALSVHHVPQGTLRRTTSGKIRRRELWREFIACNQSLSN